MATHLTNLPAKSKPRWWVAAICSLATAFITAKVIHELQPPPDVPLFMLQATSPVAVNVVFRPSLKEDANLTILEGPMTYTFTNVTDKTVRVAFPPTRVFAISSSTFSPKAEFPDFANQTRVVEISKGESKTFEVKQVRYLAFDSKPFMAGGVGPIGFVFSRPPEAMSDSGYCVGTLFPKYSVIRADDSSHEKDVIADTNSDLKMLRSLNSPVRSSE